MSARDHIAAVIAHEYALAAARIEAAIAAPDGHAWRANPRHALGWFGGDVLGSVRYGASICLWQDPRSWADLDQLHIEVRLTWNRSAGQLPDLSGRRAILRVQQGPNYVNRWRDLLPPLLPFLHHDALEPLLDEVIDRITATLPRWRAVLPETAS